jgi:MOSC domain-containing protein YiiM
MLRPDSDGTWTSAIYKEPVEGRVMLRRLNLDGDGQADSRDHGGPERAVLLYSAGHYPLWERELGRPLPFGSFGENFTVEGLDEWSGCLGDVLGIGEAEVQLSEVRGPCYKIAYRTGVPDMIQRIELNGRSGFYARVLREGFVEAGDEVRLVDRPNPRWSIDRARHAYRARSPELAEVIGLSENWARKL